MRGYAEVVYREVWEGIDLKLYGNGQALEQEFIVRPNADLSQIQVAFRGIEGLRVAEDGSLLIQTAFGELRESKPRIYQEVDGKRVAVEGRFKLLGQTAYTFEVGPYQPQYALVIDPTLVYSTYLGGGVPSPLGGGPDEQGLGIAVDRAGNAYVTGSTPSVDFPTVPFQGILTRSRAAFVTKLNATGSALVYSTYLRGTNPDWGTTGSSIAVNAEGNAYITGWADLGDFPVTAGAFQTEARQVFVTKLSIDGSALEYSSAFGSTAAAGYGIGRAIAVDGAGNAYVAGEVYGGFGSVAGFPVTPGAFDTTYNGSNDVFVAKLDATGSTLLYSTFLGGAGSDIATGIAVDGAGSAYVVGAAAMLGEFGVPYDFPTTPGAFQTVIAGIRRDGSGFLTKLNPSGSALVYSTLLTGTNCGTTVRAVAVDVADNAYVTGQTGCFDFPTTPGAYSTVYPAPTAFVSKLNATGSALVYSTFLGGYTTHGYGIAVDAVGNAYVTGSTGAPDFPTTSEAYQSVVAGAEDVFLTKLNATGSALLYSTYLGGGWYDRAQGIALDAIGDAYVTGWTGSGDSPTTLGGFFEAFQPRNAGGYDAFVAKFSTGTPTAFSLSAILPGAGGDTRSVTVSIQGTGFTGGAIVKLVRSGESDIVADAVNVAADGRMVTATFDLTGKAQGAWDVVVTNPDGPSETLAGAFTIEEGRAPQVWVDILGRDTILVGRPQTFYILYGNRGNVNARGVPLWIAGIPKDATVKLGFEITPPPLREGQPPIDWDQFPNHIDGDNEVIIPLLIPVIPPSFTDVLKVNLVIPTLQQFQLRTWVSHPWLQSPLWLEMLECAGEAFATVSKVPPGVDCLIAFGELVGKLGIDLKYPTLSAPSMHKLLFDTFLQCYGELVPPTQFLELFSDVKAIIERATKFGGANDQCFEAFREIFDAKYGVQPVAARDPNEKVGSQRAGEPQYLSGEEPLRYAVFFENEATATAPAQEVVITDQLDTAKMDLSTLSLGPLSFGDRQIVPPPGLKQYSTDVDLRPAKDLIVRIEAGLNSDTGIVTWRFTSIDPATGQLTEDPLGGFLPPNQAPPEGEGSVLFTVMPKRGLPTGTEIRNRATIVFDVNPPIDTPEWLNTLDNTKPTSQVLALAATQTSTSFPVQWSGTDVGSGILDYTIFVSEDGGSFTAWLLNTTATSETFTGQSDKTYAFYSVARDQTGNLEDAPTGPDTTTQVVADTIPPTTTASASPAPNANGWNNTDVTVTLTATDNPGGSGVKDLSYALSGATTGGSVVAGSSTTVTVSAEGTTTLTYFARDNAGNWEVPQTLTVQIDKTKPVITGSRSPGANGDGWNSTDVTVSFSCAEVGSVQSGIDTNTVAGTTLSTEGAGQSVTNTGTCTDRASNSADPATVSDINIDKTPPLIADLPATGCTLWPPNHRLVQVATVTASDALSGVVPGSPMVAGTSNEPENGLGDGDLAPDIIITGGTVQLRAERAGNGSGRAYTLTATASDRADNRAQATATCTVPHDQSKR